MEISLSKITSVMSAAASHFNCEPLEEPNEHRVGQLFLKS